MQLMTCSTARRAMSDSDHFLRLRQFAALAIIFLVITLLALSASAQELIPTPLHTVDLGSSGRSGTDAQLDAPTWSIDPQTLDRLHEPILRQDLQLTAAQSCAAANCHGGPTPGITQPSVRRGAAFQLWKEMDPHARSWRTICGDESVAIMKRLRILDHDNQIVDKAGFDNCLACHNTAKRFAENRSTAQLQEGIGCAACHGPGEQWINQHFQHHWSPESAGEQGFVNVGNLYVRARMCASCHVGDKDRDMNHDIIAAGHPSLHYELATFHAWQPKHWRDAESNDPTFYEAQLWLAGQIASADASLALLESRANDSHTISQWPELSTYDCSSCHHGLGLDNQRTPNRIATATYSRWNSAGLNWLLDYRKEMGIAETHDVELSDAFEQITHLMEANPTPDAAKIAEAARDARRKLATWFDGSPGQQEKKLFCSDRLGNVVASAAGNPSTYATWESATQFYLAAIAARESWPGGWDGHLRGLADQMRQGLAYPAMIDVSRMSKRGISAGPPATRLEVMQLGTELATGLGPVRIHRLPPDELPRFDTRRLDRMLQEMETQWPSKPNLPQPKRGSLSPESTNAPLNTPDAATPDAPIPDAPIPDAPVPDAPVPKSPNPKPGLNNQDPEKILEELENLFDSAKQRLDKE